jgi:hypothetical protein
MPELCETPPSEIRGRRECRALAAPAALCAKGETRTQANQVRPKRSGTPCAMVLRLLRALPGVPGFLATIACQSIIDRLDPSVGGSGPHGLTVRALAARLAADARPSQPAPRIVTTRFAPHAGGMTSINHNFCLSERNIFLQRALDPSGKTGGGFWCFARRLEKITLGSRVPGAMQRATLRRRPGTPWTGSYGPRISSAPLKRRCAASGARQSHTTDMSSGGETSDGTGQT